MLHATVWRAHVPHDSRKARMHGCYEEGWRKLSLRPFCRSISVGRATVVSPTDFTLFPKKQTGKPGRKDSWRPFSNRTAPLRPASLPVVSVISRLLQRTLATQGWINRRSRGGGADEMVRMAEAGSALRNVQTSLSSFGYALMTSGAWTAPQWLCCPELTPSHFQIDLTMIC